MPQIDTEYIKTGKLRHTFKDLPLESIHKNAFGAAVAAECASEQGKYWEMHEKLFENGKNLGADKLPGYATAVGLDAEKFTQCMASGKFDQEIRGDMTEAAAAGITGTPGFLIGTIDAKGKITVVKVLSGAQPFAAFKAALDEILEPPARDKAATP